VNQGKASDSANAGPGRYVHVAVWAIVLLTLILIPLRIVEYGYLPQDDALRHAAKAIADKPWSEIIVLRDDMDIDQHAGWHAVLGAIHRWTGADGTTLVMFSSVVLFWLFALSPLPWLRRPEAWVGVLLVFNLTSANLIFRLNLGRPLLVTMAVLINLLFIWSRDDAREIGWPGRIVTVLLVALAAWLHGSWYLFALPVVAFLLARQWRKGLQLAACSAVGIVLGAWMTGRPVDFFVQQIRHMFLSLGPDSTQRFLVSEFQPSDGVFLAVVAIVLVILGRTVLGGWSAKSLETPLFLLAMLGWLLGLKVYRFWSDWGLPAAMIWMTLEFQQAAEQRVDARAAGRMTAALLLCAALFLSATSDLDGRWTHDLQTDYLSADDPQVAEWLPDDGGVLYNAGMLDFYQTFFANPHGKWRYILGFEPNLMPPEDLEIYRALQWNRYDVRGFAPWVQKMQPADRLLIRASGASAPNIPLLEWRYAATNSWLGRLPRNRPQNATSP
jgi:hypothetical protein